MRPDGSLITGNNPADTSVPAGPAFIASWVSDQPVRHRGRGTGARLRARQRAGAVVEHQLIPRMKAWVAANYPGTKIGIGEYNFGGLESMNGALAQADVLGIFAREGVDMALLWSPPTATQPGAYAFRMFRNHNGQGGPFGETWIRSTSADQGKQAVYGAQRASDGALTLMVVNKTATALKSPLKDTNFTGSASAQVYQYSAASLSSIRRLADAPVSAGTVTTTYPANSITLLVLPR